MGVLAMVAKLAGGETVEALQAQREAICEAGLACHTEIERLEAAKATAGSAAELAEIQNAKNWQAVLADRHAHDLAEVDAKLKIAQDANADKLRRELMARYESAMKKFLPSARETMSLFGGLIRVKENLESAGFVREAQSLTLPGHINGNVILAGDLLATAEREFERNLAARARKLTNSPAPPAPAKVPAAETSAAAKQKPNDRRPRIAPGAASCETAPALADEMRPLTDGEVRVITVRPGYVDARGYASQRGRKLVLQRSIAEMACANGAVEIVEECATAASVSRPAATEGSSP